MKQSVTRRTGFAGILLIIFAVASVLLSCSEGIFNFNEETGNISISFSMDPSVPIGLDRIVFSLSNSDTGASIREERRINDQRAECYISRADTGSWHMITSLYDYDGNLVPPDRFDDFQLSLAQTAIADVYYSSSGGLSVVWEKPAGAEPLSLLGADKLSTLVAGFHTAGDTVDMTRFQTVLITEGTGFNTALSSLEVTFPDDGYFTYDGGWARAVSNISVDTTASILSVTRENYNSRGGYSMLISDINGVETRLYDDCNFNFDPALGLATLNGTYTSAATITNTQYDKNDSAAAGTYIAYTVNAADGTVIGGPTPTVFEDPASAANLNMSGNLAGGILVLCTLDADISQTEIDAVFVNGTTDVSPDKLPGWLFDSFGDRINFIGISIQVYP